MFSMNQLNAMMTRRQFFGRSARGLGAVALASLCSILLTLVELPVGAVRRPSTSDF